MDKIRLKIPDYGVQALLKPRIIMLRMNRVLPENIIFYPLRLILHKQRSVPFYHIQVLRCRKTNGKRNVITFLIGHELAGKAGKPPFLHNDFLPQALCDKRKHNIT